MVDKKGYLKTVEAVVALLILFGVILYSISLRQIDDPSVPEDIDLLQRTILNSVEYDDSYRDCVFDVTCTDLQDLFDIVPSNLAYNYTVDEMFVKEGVDLYVDSIIIVNATGDARTFSVYFWRVN